jgi:hypothetical protein
MNLYRTSITSTLLLPFALASTAHAQVRIYQLSGEAPGLRLGTAVSAAGDVDLDGVPDYLVGGSPTVTGSYGQVLVISGRHGNVLHTLASNVADDGFGASVLGVGDLDLDGVPDAIVGSPTALVHDPLHLGAVRAFSGRTGSLLWLVRSPEGFGSTGFGKAIAEIGDLDGDGIPEIAVGPCTELGWMGNGTITSIRVLSGRDGSVILAIGSMGGPPGVPSFGESIAGAGDVDGDGFPDILVGAPMAGYSHTRARSICDPAGTAPSCARSRVWCHTPNSARPSSRSETWITTACSISSSARRATTRWGRSRAARGSSPDVSRPPSTCSEVKPARSSAASSRAASISTATVSRISPWARPRPVRAARSAVRCASTPGGTTLCSTTSPASRPARASDRTHWSPT